MAVLFAATSARAAEPANPAASLVHYAAELAIDIDAGAIEGTVVVTAVGRGGAVSSITLDCGELTIAAASLGGRPLRVTTAEHRVTLALPQPLRAGEKAHIAVRYHGQPRRGLRFFKAEQQAYTAFSTSQWMPVDDAPDQKATLALKLSVPSGSSAVASGELVARRPSRGATLFEWRQRTPLPTYVFGFAVGRFLTVGETHRGIRLDYASDSCSEAELRRIFAETKGMLEFFEDRAGVRYPGSRYSQVLAAGRVEQEVGSFTLLSESYGPRVLADPQDVWLMAHELAHQWWGNGVTCRDWNHFWLNEGLATFLASAYKEQRFGRDVYQREVDEWRGRYERVRQQGQDKPLVFPDWTNPTANDRALVYQKGAYVVHLLREHLGEARFWAGLRAYTRAFMGRSVTTLEFQRAMEQASGADLREFFERWVYGIRGE
jgi:aminopeptidase N